ncbi:GAF and ANTAR domain-containing protein [Streptomyces sp. NPDC093094]|uniref:GAF and ANTAR domain-containing protein n=1 Tax=Streptomyces sp. NPDC093094 TaxID=3366026 RepID=UPI0038144D8B
MAHEDERNPNGTMQVPAGRPSAEPGEVAGRLCRVAVDLLPVDCADVLLCGDGMPVPMAVTCARAEQVMELQATLGEGPSLLAARTGTPVLAADLTRGRDTGRWPVFAPLAAAAGVRALYALPLGSGPCCVGTLDLCRDTPARLGARDLRTAQVMAGVVTVALTALRLGEDDTGEEMPWLGELAAGHDAVHQAVGMIMVRLRIAADEALARLRAHCFAHGRTLPEAARDVVARRIRFEPDPAP